MTGQYDMPEHHEWRKVLRDLAGDLWFVVITFIRLILGTSYYALAHMIHSKYNQYYTLVYKRVHLYKLIYL